MLRDPVCGMEIKAGKVAAKATHEGRTFYFCAVACREAFAKAPARYVPSVRRNIETREQKGAA